MRIIAFIKDEPLVKKILEHLDLWDVKRKPPPRANSPPTVRAITINDGPAFTQNGVIKIGAEAVKISSNKKFVFQGSN